jgi:hypothetical protein
MAESIGSAITKIEETIAPSRDKSKHRNQKTWSNFYNEHIIPGREIPRNCDFCHT